MSELLLINGPNLNLLGTREPDIYGHQTLADIERAAREQAQAHGLELTAFQSNAEHAIIDQIHGAQRNNTRFIVINPGAFTHTSIAIRDALSGVAIPFIEVHLSNVHSREAFRQHSYFSDIAMAVIAGLGTDGYSCAIDAAIKSIQGN